VSPRFFPDVSKELSAFNLKGRGYQEDLPSGTAAPQNLQVSLQFLVVCCTFLHERQTPCKMWNLLWISAIAVGWGTALQAGRSRVRFPIMSLEFFIDIFLPAALWTWGWLSL
jgi:hypothetical protein